MQFRKSNGVCEYEKHKEHIKLERSLGFWKRGTSEIWNSPFIASFQHPSQFCKPVRQVESPTINNKLKTRRSVGGRKKRIGKSQCRDWCWLFCYCLISWREK
jgi:hypothetical protein